MPKKIQTGLFSRSFSLAKLTATASGRLAKHTLEGLFTEPIKHLEKGKRLLEKQAEQLVGEANQLRGSLVKAGQILSMYGDSFLPKEVTAQLKKMQREVEPLPYSQIRTLLLKRMGKKRFEQLEIDPNALGAASLGQVHKAIIKATGQIVAIKVRYPGIEKAIDTDLRLMRFFLNAGKFLPADIPKERWDDIFDEARYILYQEVNYTNELQLLKTYKNNLGSDPRFIIPDPIDLFCTPSVLCTSFEDGSRIDSPEVSQLSQERRNYLSESFIDLFLKEFFIWNLVQTDPHFGNYLIRKDPEGKRDRWVLFDFGALRTFSESFKTAYITLLGGVVTENFDRIIKGGELLGLVAPSDSPLAKRAFVDLALLSGEPLHGESAYDWGQSQLPKRVAALSLKTIPQLKFRIPPKEMLSLNRKLGGIFVHLSELKGQIAMKPQLLAEPYGSILGINFAAGPNPLNK